MEFQDISVPDIYQSSMDFRFFLNLMYLALTKYKNQTENFIDLLDPLRCPDNLLWCLADTMGFKYDDRVPVAFNRLILLYFMSMIRLKGSRDGVTLAAEVNLAQFRILEEGVTGYFVEDEEKHPVWVDPIEILSRRLEYTQLPVNSVFVTPHTDEGFIEVVYFSTQKPIDSCIEYVRPLGMYIYQYSGVKFEGRTKISIDARLTNTNNIARPDMGPTKVGDYSREDYARLQKMRNATEQDPKGELSNSQYADQSHRRNLVYHRNSEYEKDPKYNAGYRTLYSLQLANNDHIVNSLIKDPESGKSNPPDFIFSIGYNPIEVGVHEVAWPKSTAEDIPAYSYHGYDYNPAYPDAPNYNLRYDAGYDREVSKETYVNDPNRVQSHTRPNPRVNPIMTAIGDKITPTSNYVPHDERADTTKKDPEYYDYAPYEQPEMENDIYSSPKDDNDEQIEKADK